jgi:hypothetical protein
MAPPEFNPAKILEVLQRHDVDFVLIGGLAAAAHGAPYPTYDVDVVPAGDPTNLARLCDALHELNARVRAEGVEGGLPFDHDAGSLAALSVWNLVTDHGALHLCFVPSGTEGFADLKREAVRTPTFGVVVRLASLGDVIRSKQAANRPKDQLVLPSLREILSRRRDLDTN